MKLDQYSDCFKYLLLRDVIIKINNKVIRSGKIKNFAIKQFYIKLFIENQKGHIRLLELPYPFSISQMETQCHSITTWIHSVEVIRILSVS